MARGDGRTFVRGTVWWVAFYRDGQEIRESTKLTGDKGERAASALLRRRLGEIAAGLYAGPQAERVTVGEILDAWLGELELRGARSLRTIRLHVVSARDAFGMMRAAALTTDRILRWMQARLDDHAARGTVKLQAAYLRAALRWAHRTQMIARVPYVPSLQVHNARQGFVDDAALSRLLAALPEPFADMTRFAALTGWRSGEYLGLTWAQVDRGNGEIRLGRTKNGDGRVVPLTGELAAVIERQRQAKVRAFTWRLGDGSASSAHVFQRWGKAVPYGSWHRTFTDTADAIGLRGLTPHDLRRTAIRNMMNAGVRERVAMQISGHRTRAVFDRYHIVPLEDMRDALDRVEADRRRTVGLRGGQAG